MKEKEKSLGGEKKRSFIVDGKSNEYVFSSVESPKDRLNVCHSKRKQTTPLISSPISTTHYNIWYNHPLYIFREKFMTSGTFLSGRCWGGERAISVARGASPTLAIFKS